MVVSTAREPVCAAGDRPKLAAGTWLGHGRLVKRQAAKANPVAFRLADGLTWGPGNGCHATAHR